jgi:hypothetical protein
MIDGLLCWGLVFTTITSLATMAFFILSMLFSFLPDPADAIFSGSIDLEGDPLLSNLGKMASQMF